MIIRRQHFLCVFKAHKTALTAVFHSFPNTVIGLFWAFWACNKRTATALSLKCSPEPWQGAEQLAQPVCIPGLALLLIYLEKDHLKRKTLSR